jgi:hypothetical protein
VRPAARGEANPDLGSEVEPIELAQEMDSWASW